MISSLFERRQLDVDAGFFLEVRGDIRRHIVRPGDDAQPLGAVDARATGDPQAQEQRPARDRYFPHAMLFSSQATPTARAWSSTMVRDAQK